MFGLSVKSVPGCLVSIVPMLIGVPVALTPGFGPHDEVSVDAPAAVAVLVALDGARAPPAVALLELLLLLLRIRPATISADGRHQRQAHAQSAADVGASSPISPPRLIKV